MVLALGLQALPIGDSFPITMFFEPIQPILSLIFHLLGDDDTCIANKATLGILRKMMQPGHLFDILAYLSEPIRFPLHHFSTTSYFRYYSLLFYLFVYTYVDEFECLGLSLVDGKKQRKYVFDWYIVIRKMTNVDGYSQFISTYMSISYDIIHGFSPPGVFPQQRELLHLTKDTMVGDL